MGGMAERGLVEDAVKLLIVGLPPGWRHLHAELEPSALPVIAFATATGGAGELQAVAFPAQAIDVLAEHQRRTASSGARWRRMIIDCDSDMTLSVSTEPAVSVPLPARSRRWPVPVLLVVALVCLGVATMVFATGWQWGPPPRAGIAGLPPLPARQREAAAVISRWVDAENRADVTALRALACANPAQSVQKWLTTLEDVGQHQALLFPDAVTKFQDEGSRLLVTVAVRIRPLTEAREREVQAVQEEGGFFDDTFTLGDEGGALKVCDVSVALG